MKQNFNLQQRFIIRLFYLTGLFTVSAVVETFAQCLAAGPISGPSTVCPGQTGATYSISSLSGATSYSWILPSGASIVGPSAGRSITVNFSSSFTGGTMHVYGYFNASCGVGQASSKNISGTGVPPSTPGTITGTNSVAPGQTGVSYSVAAVSNATSYSWTLPAGVTIASGSGTRSITVNFPTSFTGGSISVKGVNGTCSGASSPVYTVTSSNLPAAAGTISGTSGMCEGTTATFSVPVIANATTYEWVPGGGPVSIISGSGTRTITISIPNDFPTTSITLVVTGRNSFGYGAPSPTHTISVYKRPANAGAISGHTTVCPGQTATYSISPVANASSYVWSSAFGGGSTTSNSFTFPSSFTGGTISVVALNGPCGGGTSSTISVSIPPAVGAAGTITGTQSVCTSQTNVSYSVPAITNATGYVWNLPPGGTIASGANTNSITVNYSSSAASGNVSVYGTNCVSTGASSSKAVTVKLPVTAAGTITGDAAVCEGGGARTYTVSAVPNAETYEWVPTGGPVSIAPGTAPNKVEVSIGTGGSSTVSLVARGKNNACGLGPPSSSYVITVYKRPANAGAISGPTTVCPGQTATYSISPVANASSYVWSSAFGGGSTTSNSFTFPSSFTGGTISVVALNGPCGGGTSSTISVSIPPAVGAAGTITGAQSVCTSQTNVSYSVPAITNATGYVWNLPPGGTIASGANTNSITVNYSSSAASGNISVYGTNCASTGTSSSKLITVKLPVTAAGTITGDAAVCEGGGAHTYTVSTVPNAETYEWVPTGGPVSITPGTAPNKVEVSIGTNGSSTVSLVARGKNTCGLGPPSLSYAITVYKKPGNTGDISGTTLVCPGTNGVAYSVAAVTNASSYVWTLPAGATKATGGETNSITVDFSSAFAGGTIYAVGLNGPCGGGTSASLPVSIPATPSNAGTITGASVVCVGESSVPYSVPSITNATGYVWSVPSGATIVSGHNTNSIVVTFPSSAASGNVSVYGTSCSGNGGPSSLAVTVRQMPGAAGPIGGNTVVCPGETGITYSVPLIANATGYVWTVPTGATIVSGNNTNTITVDFSSSATVGPVKVHGTAGCAKKGAESVITVLQTGTIAGGNATHSVDLVTGTLNASIPLLTIQDGDVSVPVSLSYASGVRAKDADGWVGMNWNLSAQSYRISREMRDLPDDYTAASPDNRKGWLLGSMRTAIKDFTPMSDNAATTCSDEVTDYNFLSGINYDQDTQPDAFFVNAPGLSFQFFFDENKVPRVVPHQDVIITPNTTTGPITSFTVKDSKGVQYIFNETESLTQQLLGTNPYYFVRQGQLHKTEFTFSTAWYLTKIISPIYGTIDLTYRSVNTAENTLYPNYRSKTPFKHKFPIAIVDYFALQYLIGGPTNEHLKIEYSRSSVLKILDEINAPSMKAKFVSAPKVAGSSAEQLKSIEVYDKREGSAKLVKEILLGYSTSSPSPYNYNTLFFLSTVKEKMACMEFQYGLSYYNLPPLIGGEVLEEDDWNFYKVNLDEGSHDIGTSYHETSVAYSLKQITTPLRGYTAFFYEAHDYFDGTSTVQGGGPRVKKVLIHDNQSSAGDIVTEYSYKAANGQSSGKIQHRALSEFSVARTKKVYNDDLPVNQLFDTYYHQVRALLPDYPLDKFNKMFTIEAKTDLSTTAYLLHGSGIAYERVTVKQKDAGWSVYEFDLPGSFGDASANDNEWVASKVLIARQPTGNSTCFETPNIPGGINHYPFPPNPNYDFAKGLMKKVTDFREDGVKVREVTYNHQRVYGNGSSIRKIYGLALEELPTYYFTGSAYVDGKMFLFSKYELFTDVKTVLGSEIEVIYNSTDLVQKTETTKNYFYDSPNHRELARTVTLNSDGSQTVSKFKYVQDYSISTTSDPAAMAIKNLKSAYRLLPVESTVSKVTGGEEKYISGQVTVYQTIGSKVFPDKRLSFVAVDGTTAFIPAYVNGSNAFKFDQNLYTLTQQYLNFDAYGNLTESMGRDRDVSSVVYGYNGTVPIVKVAHAGNGEFRYSTFDVDPGGSSTSFYPGGPFPACVGRYNSAGITLPGGSSNMLNGSITTNKTNWFVFSFWAKGNSGGTMTVAMGAGAGTINITVPFTASSDWKYYRVKQPIGTMLGNPEGFWMQVWSDVAVNLDDVAFYPEHADVVAYTYRLPFGKSSETNSHGISHSFEYDQAGRPRVVYDRDRNIIKKYDYQVRSY